MVHGLSSGACRVRPKELPPASVSPRHSSWRRGSTITPGSPGEDAAWHRTFLGREYQELMAIRMTEQKLQGAEGEDRHE